MASEIQLPAASPSSGVASPRRGAAPTVDDVQQVRTGSDPGLRVPSFGGIGEGMEKAGALIEHGAKFVGRALERQQKEYDAQQTTQAELEFKKTGMAEFTRLQTEADTTDPEFPKKFEDWQKTERDRITGALPPKVSDNAKQKLNLSLESQSISFTDAASRLHLTAAQQKSQDLIQQETNLTAGQASRDLETPLNVLLDQVHESVGKFSGTMNPNVERDALAKARTDVIEARVTGLVKNDRFADAEKLIGSGEYDKDLNHPARNSINADIQRGKSVARAEIRDLQNDNIASLAATGVGVPGLDARASKILDPKDLANYNASVSVAKHVFSVSQGMTFATPEQIGAQLQSLEPKPGSTNFATEERAYNGVAQQADRIMKARRADPVGYAMQMPAVADAFKKAGDDPKQLPMAVNKVLAAQEQMGIPEQDRRVLSKDGADVVVKQLGQMPPEKMADNLQALAQSYGKYWGRAYRELVGQHLPAEAQILGTMDRPEDAMVRKDFATAVQTGRKTLTDNLGPQMKKTIDDGLQTALEPWARTELARGATDHNVQSMRSAAELLAYSYASRGMSPDKAATSAAQNMILNRYDVLDQSGFSMYVPKGSGGQVNDVADRVRNALKVENIMDPGGAPELTPDQRKSAYLKKAQNGKWVLNEGGDGAVLLDEIGQPVMKTNEGRVEFKFADMESMKASLPPPPTHRGTSNSIRRTVGPASESGPVQGPPQAITGPDGDVTLPGKQKLTPATANSSGAAVIR